jgi:hypothetical protein
MMSNNRGDYASPSAWLSALRQDGLWLSQLQQLQEPDADLNALREAAVRKIDPISLTFEFWDIYQHQVEPVVMEVWDIKELSLPKLKVQTIGMLSMEWIELQSTTMKKTILETEEAMKYWLRLEKAGFVDVNHRLRPETTRKQAMNIAELFAEKLSIKQKWKTFEQLWGISNLAQEKWKMQETGNTPSRTNEIVMLFND